MWKSFAIALAASAAALVMAAGGDEVLKAHQITDLPHYNDKRPINFNQYAGHLVLPSNNQKMFYWFVESEGNPQLDPLVLWLNGGPGCSSLGGFFTELGPFVVESDLSVKRNPYAWNRKANILFLESPAGVGFSSPLLNETEYNDTTTADRAYEFLAQFFKNYPSFNDRHFYVTGESYAGQYIPYLVHKLIKEPLDGVPLVGMAIGNPVTDDTIDGNAYMDYYYSHGMISLETYTDMTTKCKDQIGVYAGLYASSPCIRDPNVTCSNPCEAAVQEAVMSADVDDLNPYFIYGDVCLLKNDQIGALQYRDTQALPRHPHAPCTDAFTEKYLNLPEVREAIHVHPTAPAWSNCNDDVSRSYHRSTSSLHLYPDILATELKTLIFSGDADSVVNFIGTERWLGAQGLRLRVVEKWAAWFGPDKQLAGYTQKYDGVTFMTVKGAGHLVPSTRPLHGLYLFECFLYGRELCETFDFPKDKLEYLSGDDVSAANDDDENSTKDFTLATGGWVAVTVLLVAAVGVVVVLGWKQWKKREQGYSSLNKQAVPSYSD
ncbi:Aste57867_2420 [Aphanomyces stellatus]|uniref:Carboxypeptidase n=1 Tax=Aphanomyces stellatus TaxID=120398 RepID=A0A485K8Z4_9STRA|nr:hypothetical protein As57867_002414 [Aphanomyces stellatus]VFT79621.1 Aste57867_2420 [Aphanomyces stellatus]